MVSRFDDLQGDPAPNRFPLLRCPDRAKAALAELAEEFVTADHGAGTLSLLAFYSHRRNRVTR